MRRGEHFKDEWTDGFDMEKINEDLQKISQERNEIQNATTHLRKRKTTSREAKRQTNDAQPSTSSYTDDGFLRPELPKEMSAQEFMEQEEIYRLRKVPATSIP